MMNTHARTYKDHRNDYVKKKSNGCKCAFRCHAQMFSKVLICSNEIDEKVKCALTYIEQRFKGSVELEEMYKGNTDSESEYSDKSIDYMSEEHKEYMDKLMHQLRDKGDGLTDPFTILENDQSNEKFPIHDEHTHWKIRKPKVSEKYVDADQLKECLTYYSANRFSLWFYRSSKEQVFARCGMRPEKLKDIEKGKQRKHFKYPGGGRNEGSNCPFRCYGKMMVTKSSFQVISLNEENTCVRNFKYGNLVNYKWIGKHFGHKIRQNPEIKLHEIADLVMKKYKCIVSPSQCRNAKKFALNHGETTTEEHYAMITSYGCRPVIALDGCFLKKPNVGKILTAVGRDGNNHICPIAWAVVNVENKDNWSWFLELLGEDIDMPIRNGLTLILDQHKAMKDVMPLAEHKQCVKHIYEGFRKQYSGVQFRKLFWATSKARGKPLITMLESMRVIMMERLNTMRQIFEKWNGDIYPNIQKRLELNKDKHSYSTKKQTAKRGRPKKNVANIESGGDATIHMDESSSQVRQGGAATGINVASVGVEGLGVRRVTSKGTPAARIGRGGQKLRIRKGISESTSTARGRGGQTLGVRYGRLGRWFGLGDETQNKHNDQPTPLAQQS
uniref:Pentatricopeptide repeat-containing protein n=1 Tax=Tanacetum cinerariifolium TaxID=118510 RepID=A0A6L2NYW1_TANCI|nr:pentatricopeptide repeat-containing protein [Tanacetum cinerariifolium]